MKKIKVKKEGRKDIWIVENEEMIRWLKENWKGKIHNFLDSPGMLLGADWSKASVIKEIKGADKIGILTGKAQNQNLRHALSVIKGSELKMFDIGEVTEEDLELV